MMTDPMTPTRPSALIPAIDALRPLRRALLDLHGALLEAERHAFEREGRRLEPGELLQALLHDESWAWLRPLGSLVAGIDEAIAQARRGEGSLGEPELRLYAAAARRLVNGAPPLLGERYLARVQDTPAVTLAVGAVRRGLDEVDGHSLVVA